MNHTRKSPMLRDHPNMIKEAAPLYLAEVNENTDMIPLSFEDVQKYDNIPPGIGDDNSIDTIVSDLMQAAENVINTERHCEFQVIENDGTRSTAHTMKDNVLYAMREKDIPINVVGAQPGDVVKIGLRHTTGVHYHIPVKACKGHDDPSDPGYSFCIPKLNIARKNDNGHLFVEIQQAVNLQPDCTFSFSVVFRCWNSCHRKYGKLQKMVLMLSDIDGRVLHEKHIPLKVCENIIRDKKKGQDKKRSSGKVKGPVPKKLKQEEGDEVLQSQASTSALAPFLPQLQNSHVQVELNSVLLPFLTSLVQLLGGRVSLPEVENIGGGSSDPLSDPPST